MCHSTGQDNCRLTGQDNCRLTAFTSDPLTRHILGQPVSKIDLKEIMETGKILIMNLPIGQIGLEATKLLGSLVL